MSVASDLRSLVAPRRVRTRPAEAARALLWLSRLVLAGLVAAFAAGRVLGVTVPLRVQGMAYLALMVGLSLPHGGFEHVLNLRGRGSSFQARYLALYIGLLAGAVGAFVVAPAVGLTVAVAVTMLKGGHAGIHVLDREGAGGHLRTRWQRALGVAVRGGAVMLLGLAFHPGDFSVIASLMVRLFGGDLGPVAWAFSAPARTALAGGWLLLAGVHVCAGFVRRDGTRGWVVDAGETALLGAFFAVVPPILAVGVYFPFWYATRQTARMLSASDDGREETFALWRRLVGPVRTALLPWVGGVALFAALAVWVPQSPSTVLGWVAAYSVAVSVIGLPHVVVGGWLDRTQGIWTAGDADPA